MEDVINDEGKSYTPCLVKMVFALIRVLLRRDIL